MSGFNWAFGPKANVTEPIAALKRNGWQYADVPTASNFNWLFQEIGKHLRENTTELKQCQNLLQEISTQLTNLQQQCQRLDSGLSAVKRACDQNSIDSGNYRRAIHACLHSLNSGPGERLGLDAGVDDDYPFEDKRGSRYNNSGGS